MKPLAGVGWLLAALSAAPLHTSTIIIAHHRSRAAPRHARTGQAPETKHLSIQTVRPYLLLTLCTKKNEGKWRN